MKEAKKKQTMRYSDDELSLIKNTFAEADDLLKAIRKIMWQEPLSAIDLSVLQFAFKGNKQVQDVVRKTFLPTLDSNAPLHQVVDLLMTVQIADKSPDLAILQLRAREKVINYLDQQLRVLNSGDFTKKHKIDFNDFTVMGNKIDADIYTDMIARNTIISHIEQMLSQILVLAGRKDETVDQMKERLKRDSSR